MIITISGLPGSGKSTVGKLIAKELGFEYFSVGDLRGKMAIEKGMTLDELNKLGEQEDWTDIQADDYQRELGRTKDNIVIEGRVSFHFIPASFKIFLTVNLEEAAKRTLENRHDRADEKELRTLAEAEQALKERIESDKKRYLKYYKLNYTDPTNYDLVLDTSTMPIPEVASVILDKISNIR